MNNTKPIVVEREITNKNKSFGYFSIKKQFLFLQLIMLSVSSINLFAQETNNTADKNLSASGRVNPSTLAMEIDIPLGSYPGRGINVPISLSYSSKVWRIDAESRSNVGYPVTDSCYTENTPIYGEDSSAAWTSSLDVPVVEFTGWIETFDQNGFPSIPVDICDPTSTNSTSTVRRITVKLPSGQSHILIDPNAGSTRDGYYYAEDGSNLVYIQNSSANIFKLLMPDGSFYTFERGTQNFRRNATTFTDRNNNSTSYSSSTNIWTDTLGRTFESPLKNSSTVGTHLYSLSGITNTYKFRWEKLEDVLTDSGANVDYTGDIYGTTQAPFYGQRASALFTTNQPRSSRVLGPDIHNPTVLAEIEMPNGQSYEFSYDIYGVINKIKYPTGGEETFTYATVEPLTPVKHPWSDSTSQANRGVYSRKLYETPGGNVHYDWEYRTSYMSPGGYKVSITNPEGILTERFLHYGEIPSETNGNYGYTDPIVGRPYETLVFDSKGEMITRTLTDWTNSGASYSRWSPRMTHEERYIYDPSGNGDYVWTTTKYEYEDTSAITKPLLRKKTSQYEYQSSNGSSNFIPPVNPDGDPDTNPTPIPTPNPTSYLKRTIESKYLIYDTAITNRQSYRNKNMVGLVTATEIKDKNGETVSRKETKYDENGYSPTLRGNPTIARVWDSTQGASTDPTAYIETKAKFDAWGNQTESIDALGRTTTIEYDTTDHAFPVKVSTPIPGNGTNGSNISFVTESTFDFDSSTNTGTGLPLITTDINGVETRITYEPDTLRPQNVKTFYQGNQIGSTTETIYDDYNNKITKRTQIDSTNWSESITYYDGLGRSYRAEQLHADGNIFVDKEFYSDGKVKRVSNPYRLSNDDCFQNGQIQSHCWTTNYYDDAGRIIEVELPDGAKVKTDYAVSVTGIIGTTKQITDQAGKKRKGINDVLGRMIRVTEDPDGEALETDYVFDTLGNIRETIQGVQHRYFMHDSLGRLLYSKQPEQEANTSFTETDSITGNSSWSNKYVYDNGGNITSTTDARGVTVTATYDDFNRIILRDYSDPDTPDVSFYYDGRGLGAVPNFSKGKTTKVASSVSETRYTEFDNLGRLLKHEQRTQGEIYPTEYTYNLSGSMLTEKYPSGRVMNYEYRVDGELDKLTGNRAGNTAIKTYLNNISYDTLGNIEKMRLGNGTWESAEYNDRQQVSQIALGSFENDKSLLKIDYDYGTVTENNGSLRQQKINYNGLAHEIIQSYTYDDLNRLKSAAETANGTQSWKQTFEYDRYGNREFDESNTDTFAPGVASKINNPNIEASNNRMTKDQDGDSVNDYDYDKSGNVTLDAENQQYIYDAENRIKQFFKAGNSSQDADATYEYDGDGKRVRKLVEETSGTTETIFVYNASGQLVAEYSNQMPTSPKVSYLTEDHLGSPRIITDDDKEVVSRHDYLAFGDEVTETVGNVAGRTNGQGYGEDDEIRKQYTGYETD